MRRLKANISIGDKVIKNVTNLQIVSGWDIFTDTCVITLPKKMQEKGKSIVTGDDSLFKIGNKVEVALSYHPNEEKKVFQGYLSRVKPGIPMVLECEDAMWLLKQVPMNCSSKEPITLGKLFSEFDKAIGEAGGDSEFLNNLKEIKFDSSDEFKETELGKFRSGQGQSITSVLDDLKKKFGFHSWVRENTVYVVGATYYKTIDSEPSTFGFQSDIISSELEYKDEDDVKITITGISVLDKPEDPTTDKIEVTAGDTGGQQKLLYFHNMKKGDLQTKVDGIVPDYKYTGFFGAFLTFGEPTVFHGGRVELEDKKEKTRNGIYLIKGVEYSFGMGGFRQKIKLGAKIPK